MKCAWVLKMKCGTGLQRNVLLEGRWVWAFSPELQGETVSSDGEDSGRTVSVAAALGYSASWTDRN